MKLSVCDTSFILCSIFPNQFQFQLNLIYHVIFALSSSSRSVSDIPPMYSYPPFTLNSAQSPVVLKINISHSFYFNLLNQLSFRFPFVLFEFSFIETTRFSTRKLGSNKFTILVFPFHAICHQQFPLRRFAHLA
jgi:hypothetical protein